MRGTVEIEAMGHYPGQGACNTATTWDVRLKFSSGLEVIFAGTPNGGNSGKPTGENWPHADEWKAKFGEIATHGTVFEGSDRWAHVHRGNLVTHPEELATSDLSNLRIKLKPSSNHVADFLAAVANRQPPARTSRTRFGVILSVKSRISPPASDANFTLILRPNASSTIPTQITASRFDRCGRLGIFCDFAAIREIVFISRPRFTWNLLF